MTPHLRCPHGHRIPTVRRPGGHGPPDRLSDRREPGELAGKPLDRALLASLLEQTEPGATVADLGCGPGHVAARLAGNGARTVGIDLSAGMVEAGRRRFPQVEFRQGDFRELPAEDGEFASSVVFYAIIHLDPGDMPRAFEEMYRALRPSGLLLLSFHVGEEVRHMDEWWGHGVNLAFRFLDPAHVAPLLEAAGFAVEMHMERTHYAHEAETRRCYFLARRLPFGAAEQQRPDDRRPNRSAH
ncbi:class I SAM-dependent methyltransferase [Streptomyces sp. NPDC048442]|uniref:class I SAM-dependent methyltransferase n=1 Tax=Streptomyces sp. NPDC048442 TaxID=3154823 RepID=UPI003433E02F